MKTAKFENTTSYKSPDTKLTPRGERALRAGLWVSGIAIGSLVAVAGVNIVDRIAKDYTFSETTKSVVANFGDGPLDIARTVETSGETADLRDIYLHIEEMNPNLSDGLQAGEQVEVPDSAIVD